MWASVQNERRLRSTRTERVAMERQPLMLAFSNQKGGVGKTSNLFHVAGEFAKRKKRVLVVDCDPQGSLSQVFFGSEKWEQLPRERTLAEVFSRWNDSVVPDWQGLIFETPIDNIYVVPSHLSLLELNLSTWDDEQDLALLHFLDDEEALPVFDVVLFDTPPNLQLLTWSAMVACAAGRYGGVVTPLIPEDFASQGLVHVKRFIERVRERRFPELDWTGLCLCMVQSRLSVHIAYEEQIRNAYNDLVFSPTIPQASVFKEAISARTPVSLFKPQTAGAKQVAALADEVLKRARKKQTRKAA